jgi:hypothetical protein
VEEQFVEAGLDRAIDGNISSLELILTYNNRVAIGKSFQNPVSTLDRESFTDPYDSSAVLC